jgi:hypothetical protein
LVSATSLSAKDVYIAKKVTIEIPKKDYSVIRFPFKVTNIQLGAFSYLKEKGAPTPKAIKNNGVQKITLSKKGANNKKVSTPSNNMLNIKKIDNILTFRPKAKGDVEIIVWGYKDYPIILKIKVVDYGDVNLNFINEVDRRADVLDFEASPHEKILERITRFLHNSEANPKPRGYDNIVRKEIYDVGIKDRDGLTFARVRVSLLREIVGKTYTGQEWNVNVVGEFDNENGDEVLIPEGFELTLYEEMFDSQGVFSVSLETNNITKEHGTRVMIVRRKEGR